MVAISLFSTSVILFCFANKFVYTIFLDSTYSNIIQYLVFSFWLTSLCMKISRSIHISARGTISFHFCLSNVFVHAQSCLTHCDPMACSPLGSSVHEIFQARILEWVAFPPPRDLPNSGIKPVSLVAPVLTRRFFTAELPGKPPIPWGFL